jgi:hypothetical protein
VAGNIPGFNRDGGAKPLFHKEVYSVLFQLVKEVMVSGVDK